MTETAAGGRLEVCIVSWRAREVLGACLRSVLAQPEVAGVVVVDNASGDGTLELLGAEFPSVRVIASARNLGYAAANNIAIRATDSPFVLLLNPDTELHAGAAAALLEALEADPRAAAAAPQLRWPDGRIQPSCRSFPDPAALAWDALGLAALLPRSERFGRYRMTYWGHDTPREVDQPMASALLLRRCALDEVGLFDEGFPLYFNDVDLCFRLREAGWRIIFEPRARVTHHHGHSTRQARPAAVLASHRGLIRFYRKHCRGRVSPLAYGAVVAAAWLTQWPRAAAAWLLGRG